MDVSAQINFKTGRVFHAHSLVMVRRMTGRRGHDRDKSDLIESALCSRAVSIIRSEGSRTLDQRVRNAIVYRGPRSQEVLTRRLALSQGQARSSKDISYAVRHVTNAKDIDQPMTVDRYLHMYQ